MRGTQAIKFTRKDEDIRRRQRAAMMQFWDLGVGGIMPKARAARIDQRTLPALERRGYVEFIAGRDGFRVTRKGWELRSYWDQADPFRKNGAASQFGSTLKLIKGLQGTFDFKEPDDQTTSATQRIRELRRPA